MYYLFVYYLKGKIGHWNSYVSNILKVNDLNNQSVRNVFPLFLLYAKFNDNRAANDFLY